MSHNLVCLNGGVLCSRCGAERADNLGPCKFSADAVERERVTAQIAVERERVTAQTRVAFAQVLVATAVILVSRLLF